MLILFLSKNSPRLPIALVALAILFSTSVSSLRVNDSHDPRYLKVSVYVTKPSFIGTSAVLGEELYNNCLIEVHSSFLLSSSFLILSSESIRSRLLVD